MQAVEILVTYLQDGTYRVDVPAHRFSGEFPDKRDAFWFVEAYATAGDTIRLVSEEG